LPNKWQLQAGSLSIAFLTSLTTASFLSKVKRAFTNFPTAHHNLGSSRAMPSCLGGFTSKSNKCHEDCFIRLKCSTAHKEDLTQPLAWISHKSHKPHLEVKGRGLKGSRKSIFVGGTSNPQRGRGKLLYYPLKTSRWKLASRNWNIQFLKYSRYRPNRTLRFGNRNIRFFQGLVRGEVYEAIVFHSSHLGF
jgi:hypothetical protein